jgi:hypothetical protein
VEERTIPHEEGSGVVLNGPNKVGAGETLSGVTAPTFSAFLYPPVLELADRRDLQSRARSELPGSIPGWGTFTQTENRCDNSTKWRKSLNRNARKVNPDQKKKG